MTKMYNSRYLVLSVFSINGLSLHEVMLVLRPWDGFLLKS